jgi:hypothetical protein
VAIQIFRISLSNATVLSVAYLAMAILVEASRKWFPFRWTERASLTVEWIPARTLEWFGLYHVVRDAVIDGTLSNFEVRLILGAISVAGIFFVAMGVGLLMWCGRWVIHRAEAGRRKA